jgi:hypothetical protein
MDSDAVTDSAQSASRVARSRNRCAPALAVIAIATLALPWSALRAQEKPLPELDVVLKSFRKTLHTDRALLSQYTYLEKNTEKRLDKKGAVSKTEIEVREVYPSIEEDLTYVRVISRNGVPVDPKELEKKDREQQKKVLDWMRKVDRETPAEKTKRLAKADEEHRRENQSIDEAFALYAVSMNGRQVLDGHDALVLDFRARPDFKTKTDEGKILKKLKGRVWIDERSYELIRVDVELVDTVSFGLGMLARLNPGAHAMFQRRLVNNEIWLPATAHFTGNARLMVFKGLRVDDTVEYSDYKKFSVETNTTFSPAHTE